LLSLNHLTVHIPKPAGRVGDSPTGEAALPVYTIVNRRRVAESGTAVRTSD